MGWREITPDREKEGERGGGRERGVRRDIKRERKGRGNQLIRKGLMRE